MLISQPCAHATDQLSSKNTLLEKAVSLTRLPAWLPGLTPNIARLLLHRLPGEKEKEKGPGFPLGLFNVLLGSVCFCFIGLQIQIPLNNSAELLRYRSK